MKKICLVTLFIVSLAAILTWKYPLKSASYPEKMFRKPTVMAHFRGFFLFFSPWWNRFYLSLRLVKASLQMVPGRKTKYDVISGEVGVEMAWQPLVPSPGICVTSYPAKWGWRWPGSLSSLVQVSVLRYIRRNGRVDGLATSSALLRYLYDVISGEMGVEITCELLAISPGLYDIISVLSSFKSNNLGPATSKLFPGATAAFLTLFVYSANNLVQVLM